MTPGTTTRGYINSTRDILAPPVPAGYRARHTSSPAAARWRAIIEDWRIDYNLGRSHSEDVPLAVDVAAGGGPDGHAAV